MLETKFRAPLARPGIVTRTALLDRLRGAGAAPVISVVGPPGYGKTTLLAQWAERHPRAAWVSVDDRDNDPAALLTSIVAALDGVEPIDPTVFRAIAARSSTVACVRHLTSTIAAFRRPVALVLDHVDALTSRDARDAVAMLAAGLPAGSQLAIGSRESPPLPEARLRSQGGLVEVGVDDLAMDEREALLLVEAMGERLGAEDVRELVRKTEGWPVGIYLAALAHASGGRGAIGPTFQGDHRFIADYLRTEFLDRLSAADLRFLTRTSILDRMSGPLCDAVLGTSGSEFVLEDLERRNLLVVPLDDRREWYRYHHLFRELLARELRRREPDGVADLHRGAASWLEANDMVEAAIAHAQAAEDADTVARLVLTAANPVWASGRADTVLRWMEWFEERDLVGHYPGIAVHGALMFALMGRPGATERWAATAERAPQDGVLDDGNTVDGTVAYLRTLVCRGGVEQMRRDARSALEGLSPTSPYRAAMLHADGVGHFLDGDLARADRALAHAADVADGLGNRPFVPVILAGRGIVAVERDDWTAAQDLAARVMALMRAEDVDGYWTSALVYAWAAQVEAHRGDVTLAREYTARAARLRPLLTYALPVVSAQALVEMARAYIAIADPAGGQAVLRQLADLFDQRPDLGRLPTLAAELRECVEAFRTRALGASSLTAAELRLVQLFPTHFTFRQIGERLYVSRHTVKTQALSVYRKLGVSSRGEAITRMNELGLLTNA